MTDTFKEIAMQATGGKLPRKWLFVLIGMVLFGISGSMVLLSITFKNKPNLVDKDYYEEGRKFESTIFQQMQARNALGWDMRLQIPSTIIGETITYLLGSSGTYHFSVLDKNGNPLTGAQAMLFAYRPSDSKVDLKVKMTEVAAGKYQAYLDLPLQGAWMVTAQAKLGKDVSEVARNVYVLPAE